MSKNEKLLQRVLRGTSDANIEFEELCLLLRHFGFSVRIKGSHHIFTHEGIHEILNLQPAGKLAKTYQVKQVRNLMIRNRLWDEAK